MADAVDTLRFKSHHLELKPANIYIPIIQRRPLNRTIWNWNKKAGTLKTAIAFFKSHHLELKHGLGWAGAIHTPL